MIKKGIRSFLIFLIICAALLLPDQLTKALVAANLSGQPPFVLIDGVFEFRYIVNYGAAFSILQNRQLLFYIVTPVVLLIVLIFYLLIPHQRRMLPLRIVAVLIFSGAAGNFIDRVRLGYVIDFIYFKLINFPIFNIADCYVTIAMVLLIVLILFVYKEQDLNSVFHRRNEKKGGDSD